MKSIGTVSPDAVVASTAFEHSQMPFVWLSTVCPTLNPEASPTSWFMRKDLPERYLPATITTAARLSRHATTRTELWTGTSHQVLPVSATSASGCYPVLT